MGGGRFFLLLLLLEQGRNAYAMKWNTSSSSVAVRCVSSMKGDERANELCVSRIRSELERVSPRSFCPGQHMSRNIIVGSTYVWWEVTCKLLELSQFLADINLLLSVQQKRYYRLCSTGILYGLRREEDGARRLVVVGAVLWYIARLLAGRVFEEEDDSIDCTEVLQVRCFECGELFELYVLDTELLNQIGEYALRESSVGEEDFLVQVELH